MGIAVFTFLAIFLLFVSGGLLLFHREALLQRLSTVIAPSSQRGTLSGALHLTGQSIGGMMEQFERVLPKNQADVSRLQQRLITAGYRKDSTLTKFHGSEVLVPLVLCILATVTGVARSSPFLVYGLCLVFGFLAPGLWLSRQISKRQAAIRRGLPDVLDVLVICIEAGQSLDQATKRTTEELRDAHPALSDELAIVVLEQRAGRARSDAWRNLADRTGVETVRNLVSVLIQSEQFGTSAAKSLRVHSDTLRTQRRQAVEEQAAKTTIKLVFPLVFFIFPSLFLVTLGPAVIIMIESFHKYLIH